jgi:hypothetical protein
LSIRSSCGEEAADICNTFRRTSPQSCRCGRDPFQMPIGELDWKPGPGLHNDVVFPVDASKARKRLSRNRPPPYGTICGWSCARRVLATARLVQVVYSAPRGQPTHGRNSACLPRMENRSAENGAQPTAARIPQWKPTLPNTSRRRFAGGDCACGYVADGSMDAGRVIPLTWKS